MLTKNTDSLIPELIKRIRHSFRQCEFDEVQNKLMDGQKIMKDEITNLVRERDSLKNELDSLQRTQGFTELEKCNAEEKLGRSERRCEELDKLIVQMREEIEELRNEKSDLEEKMVRSSRKSEKNDKSLVKMKKEIGILRSKKLKLEEKMIRSSRKSKEKDESLVKMEKEIEKLRRENVNANKSIELKAKEIEADRVVKELMLKNVEAVQTIDELRTKMEDLSSLANGTDNFAAAATDAEVEGNANHFIMSPEVPATSGAGNLAHSGTKEDDANMVCTSKPHSGSAVAESNAIVQDTEGQEVRELFYVERSPSADEESDEWRENPNMELQVEWEYRRPDLIDVHHKINMSGKETIIGEIRKKLESYGSGAIQAMRASAFGIYMNYHDYITKSQKCIHYIVSRQVTGKPNPDPTALWFEVEDEIVRFSKVEFALVTGLKFGSSDFDPYKERDMPASSLYARKFHNQRITPSYLWNLLFDKEVLFDAADAVKICKVMIAALIVLGFDPSNSKIPDWVWTLVEDAEEWDKFPWGSMSYQILSRSIMNVKRKLGTHKGYHLHGNTLALMGWIYTAFPDLGRDIGGLREDIALGSPCGLRFIYHKSYNNIIINEILGVLDPTIAEMDTDYMRSLEEDGSFFKFTYDHGYEKKREKTRRFAKREVSPPPEPSNRGTHDTTDEDATRDVAREAAMAVAREDAAREAAGDGGHERAGDGAPATKFAEGLRKRDLEEISDIIVKKLKVELESTFFMEKLTDDLMSRMPATTAPRTAN